MLREVQTENGWLRGLPAADPRITAYKGIPFAKPPVGELRWRAPEPADDWSGVREAFEFAAIPMQSNPGDGDPESLYNKEFHVDKNLPMSEDCLYLNVWTPARTGDELLPVMVWIYGGAFQHGYTSEMEFDGERMARRGVIVVSVSYRLNVFGFLAHPDLTKENPHGVATNFGLQDQKAGLAWVQRNIAAFGGDPNNVTLFGQSAGGGSVMAHLASPEAEGLFHKAIVQSAGGILTHELFGQSMEDAESHGQALMRHIGVESIDEARSIDGPALFRLAQAYLPFSLVIDGTYLPHAAATTFIRNEHKQIPLMIGCTRNEFIETCDIEGMEPFSYNNFELGNNLMARLNAERSGPPLYNYYFDPEIPGDDHGSFHSSELWFMFETLAKCWRPFVGKHYDLARWMCNYWTNFAKYSDPNGVDADGTPMPTWTPERADVPGRMFFGDTCGMQERYGSKQEQALTDYYYARLGGGVV